MRAVLVRLEQYASAAAKTLGIFACFAHARLARILNSAENLRWRRAETQKLIYHQASAFASPAMPLSVSLDARLPVIRLTGEIDMTLALALLDELALLYGYYQYRNVELQINSPGGDASALHYLVEQLAPWRKAEGRTLKTAAMSDVCSAAAMLLSFGTNGHRSAMKHSRLLYHAARTIYTAGASQTGSELKAATRRLERWDKYFVDLMAEHIASGDAGEQAACKKKLKRLFQQEKYITPEEACRLRLIDHVLERGA
jgi:ATP-dependent protease ClpP protease subunit